MLTTYRRIFQLPGAAAFSAAGFVMRMPISMLSIGIVLLITAEGGSYTLAGAVTALLALATALVSPLLGRIADRRGQAGLLVTGAVVQCVGLAAVVVGAVEHAPAWVLLAVAAVAGAAQVPVGTMVRIRWSRATEGTAYQHTAYSWESVLDEVIFIAGPVLATLLCTRVAPSAGLLAAIGLLVAGVCWLAPQRSSEPVRHEASGRGPAAVRYPAVSLTALASAGLGGLFGSVELSVVAFTAEEGRRGLAGLVLACFAFGSMVAGLVLGAARLTIPPAVRLAGSAAILTAVVAVLGFLPDTYWLAVVIVLAGLFVAPALISSFAVIEAAVPAAARTEAMAWLTTGLGLGIAVCSPVVGRVIDAHGARWGFAVPVASGLFAAVFGAFAVLALRRTGVRSEGVGEEMLAS